MAGSCPGTSKQEVLAVATEGSRERGAKLVSECLVYSRATPTHSSARLGVNSASQLRSHTIIPPTFNTTCASTQPPFFFQHLYQVIPSTCARAWTCNHTSAPVQKHHKRSTSRHHLEPREERGFRTLRRSRPPVRCVTRVEARQPRGNLAAPSRHPPTTHQRANPFHLPRSVYARLNGQLSKGVVVPDPLQTRTW
jgi:hypothetical protein